MKTPTITFATLLQGPHINGEASEPVFPNRVGKCMSRSGVEHRLRVVLRIAARTFPSLATRRISPHARGRGPGSERPHSVIAICACAEYDLRDAVRRLWVMGLLGLHAVRIITACILLAFLPVISSPAYSDSPEHRSPIRRGEVLASVCTGLLAFAWCTVVRSQSATIGVSWPDWVRRGGSVSISS
jgi:hypothetical protein